MGKHKRTRQKYHLLKKAEISGDEPKKPELNNQQALPNLETSSLSTSDNIFSGLKISLDDLNIKLKDDDVISVLSKKTEQGKKLTKKEKMLLRHQTFLRKLEVVEQAKKEAKGRKKRQKKATQPADVSVPSLVPLVKIKKMIKQRTSTKRKGCPKMKQRQKNMLKDISIFQKVLANPEFKANPTETITTLVQQKMEHEASQES